jgi:ABC-type antimicrobial peptide transport system permease subunit
MEERDALIGCIIGSILGFWVAQYLSTLPTWSGTPILANCNNLTYCNFIIPFSIVAVLITISVGLWEILMKPKKQR